MMSVATCDHEAGISASVISNTIEPSGLLILESRYSHAMLSYGSTPASVKRRLIRRPWPMFFSLSNVPTAKPQGTECPALGGAAQAGTKHRGLQFIASATTTSCGGYSPLPRDLVVCYANVVTRVKVVNHQRVLFRA